MNSTKQKRSARKSRANIINRLNRLKTLRNIGAPKWAIKSEQVALVLNRQGLRHTGIGSDMSAKQKQLYTKHVVPLMGV